MSPPAHRAPDRPDCALPAPPSLVGPDGALPRGRPAPLQALGKWDSALSAGLARAVIDAFAPPGSVVMDPFCESAAPTSQALAAGHNVVAVARNSRTSVLLRAATGAVEGRRIIKRLVELRNDMFYGDPSRLSAPVRKLADAETLSRLVHLRDNLDVSQKADAAIAALICHLLDTRQFAPPTPSPHGADADVFDALLDLARATYPWKDDSAPAQSTPPAPHGSPSVHVWLMDTDHRLERLGRLTRLVGRHLVVGQAPLFDEKRPCFESRRTDWRLRPPTEARQVNPARRISDIPGYLAFMTLNCMCLCGALAPGATLALWIGHGRLKRRDSAPIPLAERLWQRIDAQSGGAMRLVDLATDEQGTNQLDLAGRLLILQKTSA